MLPAQHWLVPTTHAGHPGVETRLAFVFHFELPESQLDHQITIKLSLLLQASVMDARQLDWLQQHIGRQVETLLRANGASQLSEFRYSIEFCNCCPLYLHGGPAAGDGTAAPSGESPSPWGL